eukprot:GDKJ01053028.1.p1 GENE.GDKJ01053028.1~~GDKJ01053028.1.p1  ORF type:complete len:678 (-),score=164.89 GDKJ01053028.1:811-2622(-)
MKYASLALQDKNKTSVDDKAVLFSSSELTDALPLGRGTHDFPPGDDEDAFVMCDVFNHEVDGISQTNNNNNPHEVAEDFKATSRRDLSGVAKNSNSNTSIKKTPSEENAILKTRKATKSLLTRTPPCFNGDAFDDAILSDVGELAVESRTSHQQPLPLPSTSPSKPSAHQPSSNDRRLPSVVDPVFDPIVVREPSFPHHESNNSKASAPSQRPPSRKKAQKDRISFGTSSQMPTNSKSYNKKYLAPSSGPQGGDEESTVASTRKSSSTFSQLSHVKRVRNAIFRRSLSSGSLCVWLMMTVYVTASLAVGINSVSGYNFFYDASATLMLSSFDFAIAALYNIFMRRGQIDFCTTPHALWLEWARDYSLSARERFFEVIDGPSKKHGVTLGRVYPAVESLLYDAVCLPEVAAVFGSDTGVNECGDDRFFWSRYSRLSLMRNGLVRAVLTFTDFIASEEIMYRNGNWGRIRGDDANAYFPQVSLAYDLEPGMFALRQLLREEATRQVDSDAKTQTILLCGGIVVALLSLTGMHLLSRVQQQYFEQSMLLLRFLPSRMIDDYRLIEKVFGVVDDDDVDVPSQADVARPLSQSFQQNGNYINSGYSSN